QPLFNLLPLRSGMRARLNLPFIEPNMQAVASEPLGQLAHYGYIFGAVAQENVVLEGSRHKFRGVGMLTEGQRFFSSTCLFNLGGLKELLADRPPLYLLRTRLPLIYPEPESGNAPEYISNSRVCVAFTRLSASWNTWPDLLHSACLARVTSRSIR